MANRARAALDLELQVPLEVEAALHAAAALECFRHVDHDLVGGERLDQVAPRALVQCAHRELPIGVSGTHDHAGVHRRVGAYPGQQLQAVLVRQVDVGEHDGDLLAGEGRPSGTGVAGRDGAEARVLKPTNEQPPDVLFVLDDQDTLGRVDRPVVCR